MRKLTAFLALAMATIGCSVEEATAPGTATWRLTIIRGANLAALKVTLDALLE